MGNDHHLGASITFEDTIIYYAHRQVTVIRNKFIHSRYYASSSYLQVLKRSNQILERKPGVTIFFSDVQGRLTPKSVMGSSKLLWLSLIPARMKKTHPEMKALEWS